MKPLEKNKIAPIQYDIM